MTNGTKLGVGTSESNLHHALEELVDLEAIVPTLGRLAGDDAAVGLG
eukprot:CAMPEP_0174752098 /NCGR_PEP_ID=MMETSP1094-20130205/101302_1 /TAXON_ID=156173 /ORGANISM="Chrysochromulina brevifilum, Strain UTEX LB 985" /LENGTH=46 /DNA_ID= /DNA_START= /DNA_END= /DNA_ORIENTATION=